VTDVEIWAQSPLSWPQWYTEQTANPNVAFGSPACLRSGSDFHDFRKATWLNWSRRIAILWLHSPKLPEPYLCNPAAQTTFLLAERCNEIRSFFGDAREDIEKRGRVKRLLAFCGFAHNSQRVLVAVSRCALVGGKCNPDLYFCFVLRNLVRFKLGTAAPANSDSWQWGFRDSQLALLHDQSLARSIREIRRGNPIPDYRCNLISSLRCTHA